MGTDPTLPPLTTDWHCHLLPGIDDGAQNIDDSIAMARLLADAGIRKVCCTPHHIHGSYQQKPEILTALREDVQAAVDREGIQIRLLGGAEYYLDEFFPSQIPVLIPLGESNMVLVEPPWQAAMNTVRPMLQMMLDKGFQPIIAHPERLGFFAGLISRRNPLSQFLERFGRTSSCPQAIPDELRELQELGCGFQGNLGSFQGRYGTAVRHLAETLHQWGIYTLFGTDGHTPASLQEILGRAPLR